MGRSPVFLGATLRKLLLYCKANSVCEVKSNCLCTPGQGNMTMFSDTFPDIPVVAFVTEGRFLVSELDNRRHEKVDVKRVVTEIQENDEPQSLNPLLPPSMRSEEVFFFRHLLLKCDFCAYFTSDIRAFLGNQCPHCGRDKRTSPETYFAQTRRPEQPMDSVWYRSTPTSYMVTDVLESYPLSHHKELCNVSDFMSERRKLRRTDGYEEIRDCLSPDEVLNKFGKWEDCVTYHP